MIELALPCFIESSVELPLDAVAPDPDQPRTAMPEAELAELAQSLRAHRVIQPIVVTPHPEGEARSATPYMILVGERRWRAAKLAGLATLPAVIRHEEIPAADRLLLQIAENDERSALGFLERARAYQRAHHLSRLSQREFAERCGKTKGWMSRLLRIANAEGLLRQALEEGLLHDVKAARLFEQLPAASQRSLLAAARGNGLPITLCRMQATSESAPRKRGESARLPPPPGPAPAAPPIRAPAPPRAPCAAPVAASIDIPFTYAMLRDNLRFLGAKALPTLEAAAAQLVRLLAAGGAA